MYETWKKIIAKGRDAFRVLCHCAGYGARAAHAAPYYVTVAGLGGEPDYEQRFTALAKDLDKLFKAAGERRARLHADRQRLHESTPYRHAGRKSRTKQSPTMNLR